MWFYAGFAPAFYRQNVDRRVKRRTDCHAVLPDGTVSEDCRRDPIAAGGYADGQPDVDPETGFYITDLVEESKQHDSTRAFNMVGKINFAVTPEHQGQVSAVVQPLRSESQAVYGIRSDQRFGVDVLTSDVSAKWTSKFNDNKTEVEAVVGWHRASFQGGALDSDLNDDRAQLLIFGNLGTWSNLMGNDGMPAESVDVRNACTDGGANDPYPLIENCADDGAGYVIGGPGGIGKTVEDRRSIKVGVTQRFKALGSHELKAGGDLEDNLYRNDRVYSGGGIVFNYLLGANSQVRTLRWVQLAPENTMDDRFDNLCRTPDDSGLGGGGTVELQCDYLGGNIGDPGTVVKGKTFNWSVYLRDSWQIKPNLTVNAGVRYEEQRLRYAEQLCAEAREAGVPCIDPLTDREIGKNAMTLQGMFAPRVGILYDWTKEGRSKIYGHWGRFYESIPLDINDRSFGGEVLYDQLWSANTSNPAENQCGDANPNIGGVDGNGCLDANDGNNTAGIAEDLFGSSGVLVAPGIKAQYMDEIIAGVEYELMDDLKLGIALQNRRLGRVIEDVSTDGADTYIIANPGEWSEGEEQSLRGDLTGRVDDINAENPMCTDPADDVCQRLVRELGLFRGIRLFDKPTRDYNALQFTVTRRFSKSLYLQGSYTYARVQGNFPGLYSPNNRQVDPNISSQYDLIELLANRNGPLPQDRPHYIKIDGYYTFDLKKLGKLTTGARFRALSGVVRDALGPHYLYGPNESFVLPRGTIGRTDFEHSLDMHIGYGRDIGRGMAFEIFADLYNIYNRQGTAGVDDTYVLNFPNSAINPIAGGSYEDLIFAKAVDDSGAETSNPVVRNPNFGNTNQRYRPLSVQLGARLTF